MNTTQTNSGPISEPTSDERLLSMLCHLSVVLGGIILPIIIWATQKDKSKFVRFHSLQSIFYHLAVAAIIIVFVFAMVFMFLIFGISIFGSSHHPKGDAPPAIFFVVLALFYGGIFILAFGAIGYGIYVAIKSYQGKLVRIPVIGNIIYNKVYGS